MAAVDQASDSVHAPPAYYSSFTPGPHQDLDAKESHGSSAEQDQHLSSMEPRPSLDHAAHPSHAGDDNVERPDLTNATHLSESGLIKMHERMEHTAARPEVS